MHKDISYICDICGKTFQESEYEDASRIAQDHEKTPIAEGNDGRGYHGIILCNGEPYPRNIFFLYVPKDAEGVDENHNRLYRVELGDTDSLAAIDLKNDDNASLEDEFGLGKGGPLYPSWMIDNYVESGEFYSVGPEILKDINEIYKSIRNSPLVRDSVPGNLIEWKTIEDCI
ncbi:MAG: hypothetical protein ACLFSL_05285 [Candidatus Woesearchaeota archaeon]